jgi:hypothetical protein
MRSLNNVFKYLDFVSSLKCTYEQKLSMPKLCFPQFHSIRKSKKSMMITFSYGGEICTLGTNIGNSS